jgi:hypothetical protein
MQSTDARWWGGVRWLTHALCLCVRVHGKTLQESFQMDYKKQREDTMNNLEAIKPLDVSDAAFLPDPHTRQAPT